MIAKLTKCFPKINKDCFGSCMPFIMISLNNIKYEISYDNQRQISIAKKFNQKIKQIKNLEKQKQSQKQQQQFNVEEQNEQQENNYIDPYQAVQKELQQQLISQQAKLKEQHIKKYILTHMSSQQVQENLSNDLSSNFYIPKHLVIKKLYFGKKQILLLGVRQQLEDHSLFVKKILQHMKIKSVVVGIPPDMPYFIKTQSSFAYQWKRFITKPQTAQQTRFYISPTPNNLKQVTLTGLHIKAVKHGLIKSEEFHQMIHTMLKYDNKIGQFVSDPLLTPFVTNGIENLYFAQVPLTKQRLEQAKSLTLQSLRQLFSIYIQETKKSKSYFDPLLLFPKQLIKIKLSHIINITRVVSSQSSGRIALLVNVDQAQKISQHWEIPQQQQITPYFNFVQKEWPKVSLIEIIQKLVILDLILSPILSDYYVKYQSFPYLLQQTIGGQQHINKIFMIWEYYATKYGTALKNAKTLRQNNKVINQL